MIVNHKHTNLFRKWSHDMVGCVLCTQFCYIVTFVSDYKFLTFQALDLMQECFNDLKSFAVRLKEMAEQVRFSSFFERLCIY